MLTFGARDVSHERMSETATHKRSAALRFRTIAFKKVISLQKRQRWRDGPCVRQQTGCEVAVRQLDVALGRADTPAGYRLHACTKTVDLAITAGKQKQLLRVIDRARAEQAWGFSTAAGPVLAVSPYMVRTTVVHGEILRLTGDTSASPRLAVHAPVSIDRTSWNGQLPALTRAVHRGQSRRAAVAAVDVADAWPVMAQGWCA